MTILVMRTKRTAFPAALGKACQSEIADDQPLLAVRVAVFDPSNPESFEPTIQYAVMSDWALGDASTDRVGQRFELQSSMVRRIPRAFGIGAEKGKGLRTSAGVKRVIRSKKKAGGSKKRNERRLSCLLPLGITTVPLFTLNTAEELDRLVESIKGDVGQNCAPVADLFPVRHRR